MKEEGENNIYNLIEEEGNNKTFHKILLLAHTALRRTLSFAGTSKHTVSMNCRFGDKSINRKL